LRTPLVDKNDYLYTPTGRIKLTYRLSCANWYLRGHLFALKRTICGTN